MKAEWDGSASHSALSKTRSHPFASDPSSKAGIRLPFPYEAARGQLSNLSTMTGIAGASYRREPAGNSTRSTSSKYEHPNDVPS
jgi:hypothetical protein